MVGRDIKAGADRDKKGERVGVDADHELTPTANPVLTHGLRLPGRGGTTWTVRCTKRQVQATEANGTALAGRPRCDYGSEGWGFEFLRAR